MSNKSNNNMSKYEKISIAISCSMLLVMVIDFIVDIF